MVNHTRIVKQGSWLYDGKVPRKIRITRESISLGSGDEEDPPEIRDERSMECFTVWYETDIDKWNAGGGYFATLQEAISHRERIVGSTVRWS